MKLLWKAVADHAVTKSVWGATERVERAKWARVEDRLTLVKSHGKVKETIARLKRYTEDDEDTLEYLRNKAAEGESLGGVTLEELEELDGELDEVLAKVE